MDNSGSGRRGRKANGDNHALDTRVANRNISRNAAKRDAAWMQSITEDRSQTALTALFSIYAPKLKGWVMARSTGAGTAEDIVQDVMIKVWTHSHLFDPSKASFATWVYRLTRNKLIDHKRKHSRMEVRDPEFMKVISDDEVSSAESDFIQLQDNDRLGLEIAKLSEPQQEVIRMAFMEFKTHRVIAQEMDIPLGTIKTRIRSAIQVLRTNMSEAGNKEGVEL